MNWDWDKLKERQTQSGGPPPQVDELVKKFKQISFYKGLFPQSARGVKGPFSLVHLDVDLYCSTKEALKFFYPRLSPGGIIISHDYQNLKGVKRAVDEFFKNKPEPVIELTGSQCLIVKLGGKS